MATRAFGGRAIVTSCNCGDEDRGGYTHIVGTGCLPDEMFLAVLQRYRRTAKRPDAYADVRPMLEIAADVAANARHMAEHSVVSPASDVEVRMMLWHGLNPCDQQQLRGFRVGRRHPEPEREQCYDAHAYEEYGL
jgi:hypothetical protein